MSRPNVTIPAGGSLPTLAATVATATAPADDFAAVTPNADGFVCGLTRAVGRCRAGGIAIVVTTAPVPGVACTYRAVLTVVNDHDVALSEPLVVCDFSAVPVVAPLAGHVLRLGMPPLDVLTEPGQEIALIWSETGDLGAGGTRPEFIVLGWPLVAAEASGY